MSDTQTVIMPKELTAENGAKCLMMGTFVETVKMTCPECAGQDIVDKCFCEVCDGKQECEFDITISWDAIKAIYAMAVEHLAVEEEVK